MKTIHADSVHLRATDDFKKRARHTLRLSRRLFKRSATIVFVAGLIVIVVAVSIRTPISAATYTWTQSSWSGGPTANTGVHPTNQNGWTEYSAKDATVAAGASISLQPESLSLSDTTDSNFTAGTLNSTTVAGTGSSGQVELTQSEGSTPVESTYLSGSLGFPWNTLDPDGNLWAVTNGSPYSFHKVTPAMVGSSFSNTCSAGNSPAGIAYDPVTPAVWITNGPDRKVCRFNPATGAELSEATIGSSGSLGRLVYDPANQVMWALNYSLGILYKLDLSGAVLNTYDLLTESGHSGNGINILAYEPTTASLFTAVYDFNDDSNYLIKKPTSGAAPSQAAISYVGAGSPSITVVPTTPAVWIVDANWGSYRVNASTMGLSTFNPGTSPTTITYDSVHDVVWTTHSVQPYLKKWTTAGASIATYNTTNRGSSYDAQYDPVRKRMWSTRGSAGLGIWSVSFISYGASGTFVSRVLDTTVNQSFGLASWTADLPTGTTLSIKARTSASPTMVGAPDFATCGALTSGQDINDPTCVTDGHRYIQYQASLATSNVQFTPALQSLTIQYAAYSSGTLTSSSFDAGDATNVVSKIAWAKSGSGTVQFQLRTSPDNASWTAWLGPTGTGDYYTDSTGNQVIHSSQTDGSGDRYMQWKVFLSSADGLTTPTLTGVTMTYVVNAPPEFQAAPTASQGSDGIVNVSFSIRDADTTAGSVTGGFVTPTYEYSINNGTNWNAITAGLSVGATSNKAVQEVQYTDYAITWDAKQQIDGTYASQAKIRVRLNDNEGANNTALSDSAAFALDVKDPTIGSPAIAVDATTSPATVTLNASDDTALEMCVTLNNTQTNCVPYASTTTIGLATNPDTVYVVFRDARGNLVTANAVTPEMPQNVIIRDLSNLEANQYFLFVSWKSVSTPLGQFSAYQVWHSTDGSNYSLLQSINDRSINYFLHQGLIDDSTHYYKIATVDTSGNVSYFSSVVNDTVNGQGGTDATPPLIANVGATTITTQSAVIGWETDELANSTVGYSTTPGSFTNEVGVSTMLDSAAGLGPHAVVLTNLEPARTYFYRVQSTDPSDNTATSDNGGDGYSFTTVAGPTITNVTTPAIENTQATIAWRTNVAADSEIVYSTNASLASPLTASDATELTDHSLTLTNLSLGTRYYFKIRSGTAIDTNSGHYYTFVTTSDATPPVISGVTADPITDTEAVLQWQTNEKSTSRVRYGTSHGTFTVEVPENLTLNLSHSVTLKNLTPDSTYHVAVESADAAGNRTTGEEYDFVTLEKLTPESEVVDREDRARAENSDATAPAITGLTVSGVTDAVAVVAWQTNEAANSFVEFGPAGSEPIIYGNWVFVANHAISLTALAASTTYQYRVVSVDEFGNIATTGQATFTTAAPSTVGLESRLEQEYERLLDQGKSVPIPVISGEPRVDVAPTSATIAWTTDKPANGFVAVAGASDYQPNRSEPYVQVVGDPERFGLRHTVTLSNLLPDTVYHYQVRSRTTVSEIAQTRDATFRTPKRTFAIDNYVVEKMSENEAIFRWTTTDEATALVKFIPYRNNIRAVDEVQIVRVDAYTVIHQVSVTRFEPGVKYDVELISAQRNGSLASRTIDAFSTEAVTTPPSINGIAVDTALSAGEKVKVQTIVSWSTNKPTTGRVTYRKGVAKNDDPFTESSPVDANYTKKHVIVLTTLEPGTVYQYRVESTDSAGQVSVSKPMTILTPQQQRTVFQVIFDTVQDTFGWAGLFNR